MSEYCRDCPDQEACDATITYDVHIGQWGWAMDWANDCAREFRQRYRVYRTTCDCWDWMPADEWGRWQA